MPMKVTVCFDRVRVIVPCGDGDLLVKELTEKAILRYKKAIGKSNDHWVSVHNLRTINDGGILDPDDQLNDVVDDREQLIADYEEQGGQTYQPHNGDGASQSSAGTASPDIFQGGDTSGQLKTISVFQPSSEHDVVVTSRDIESHGSSLTVRHGSEPTLNILDDDKPINSKKGKAAEESSDSEDFEVQKEMAPSGDGSRAAVSRFSRDTWRQSLGNRPDMYKWLEAQERQQERLQSPIPQMERREPVGGVSTELGTDSKVENVNTTSGLLIHLPNDGGPLGIHVVPDYDDAGKELGLLVQGVEEGGRVFKDGRLRENDRIIEINTQTLVGVSFSKAQDIFRCAMRDNDIRLRIMKKQTPPPLPKQPPPPVMPKPKNHTPMKPSPLTLPPPRLNESDLSSPTGPEQTSTPIVSVQNSSSSSIEGVIPSPVKPAIPAKPSSPTKKVPPAVPTRNPNTALSGNTSTTLSGNTSTTLSGNASTALSGNGSKERNKLVAPTNTKKIGKKLDIVLVKGPVSLGFSVTTRDNPAGGDSPIYIKNILPRGAAITDGRLKAGDRLLEVNGEDLTGKTQADVVAMLRNVTMGSSVRLVISRQEVVDEKFQVPRELPQERSGDTDGSLTAGRNKEILRLDIPLSDTGSAGLGVSVKGKTMSTDRGTRDLGIFVKSVIHGGAASKDGRLAVNDQLIEVNNEKLMGLSNTDAMEMLRKAMQLDGPIPGHIHLVIARKIGAPSPSPFTQEASADAFVFGADNKMVRETDHVKNLQKLEPPWEPHRGLDYMDGGSKARNFLIDRLTNGGLRNESYTKATREEFDDSAMSHDQEEGLRNQSYSLALHGTGNILSPGISPFKPSLKSTPLVGPHVMIENEEEEMESRRRVRPHSTIGFLHQHSNSSSSEDLNQQPVWLQGGDWGPPGSPGGEELSPTSPLGEFKREGFGRQSMSEKRKGHIDPSRSEIYQRVKSNRQRGSGDSRRAASFHVMGGATGTGSLKRVGSAESLLSRNSRSRPRSSRLPPLPVHGQRIMDRPSEPPQSNLKRFSSLENLAQVTTGDTDDSRDSLDASHESQEDVHRPVKLGRGRGCNLSFRAAVDRSYDPVPQELSTMDPQVSSQNEDDSLDASGGFTVGQQVEEESSEGGSVTQGAVTTSGHSSMSSEPEDSRKAKKKPAKEKKGPGGIFKGLLRRSNKNKKEGTKAQEEIVKQTESEEPSKLPEAQQDSFMDLFEETEDERIQDQVRQLQEQQSDAAFIRLEHKYSDNSSHFSRNSPQLSRNSPQLSRNSPQLSRNSPHLQDNTMINSSQVTDTPSWITDNQSHFTDANHRLIKSVEAPDSMSRAEWIQHLRRKHQRRHQEREGQYPLDDTEERYEEEIQQEETRVGIPWHDANQRYGKSAIPENILYPQHPSVVPDNSYHRYQGNRPQNVGHPYPDRPLSRPAYQEPSSYHHNYEYHDNVIHQRQRSNEYIPQRQQAIEHFHQRQNSDLSEQHTQEFYSQRLTPTRPYTPREHWQNTKGPYTPREHWQNTESAPALMRQYPHPQPPPGPAPQYGDPIFAYRDPIYTSMAGKRSVQSLSQTGSAKV
ncbi:partitioning defective 3 homolog isoform X5 [Ostrea edulis]|uniref:partitioning defective 3 homolog isoform X5 n=1 Tax=Ostrea edulis TaxID=37623 RepID=UPI0024AEDED5|nr:partitioning defective 3 homolog isoform X5 [Ostrea edulis]